MLPALDEIAPLQKAPFILAVHYDHLVRLIGFYTRKSAHEAFDAIEGDLSRVLVGTTACFSLCMM